MCRHRCKIALCVYRCIEPRHQLIEGINCGFKLCKRESAINRAQIVLALGGDVFAQTVNLARSTL